MKKLLLLASLMIFSYTTLNMTAPEYIPAEFSPEKETGGCSMDVKRVATSDYREWCSPIGAGDYCGCEVQIYSSDDDGNPMNPIVIWNPTMSEAGCSAGIPPGNGVSWILVPYYDDYMSMGSQASLMQ